MTDERRNSVDDVCVGNRQTLRFQIWCSQICLWQKADTTPRLRSSLSIVRLIDWLISMMRAAGTMNRSATTLQSAVAKLCRKTHIDIANKAQVNMYATGLHEVGSSALNTIQCLNFMTSSCSSVPPSINLNTRVDKQLNVLPEEAPDI